VLGILAIGIAVAMAMFFRSQRGEHAHEAAYGAALKRLLPYFAAFFVAVVAIYVVATEAGLSEWLVAVVELALALVLVGFICVRRGDDVGRRPAGRPRHEARHGTQAEAGGVLVHPGRDHDRLRALHRDRRQRRLGAGRAHVTASLFFNALQPMAHALVADLVPERRYLGAAFGMNNLIGEMGAVLAPALSGVLRDATCGWSAAVLVDGGLILMSFVLFALVRESKAKFAPGRG
jgi:cyanate permease